MKTGAYISGFCHLAVFVWAIIAGVAQKQPDATRLKVTDISVISTAEFSALASHAPVAKTNLEIPSQPAGPAETPDAPGPDNTPKRPDLTTPQPPQPPEPRPEKVTTAPASVTSLQVKSPDQAEPPTTEEQGVTLAAPTAPIANRDNPASLKPDRLAVATPLQPSAPRVDTTPAPAPPTDAEKSKDTQKATTPDPNTTTPAVKSVEKAPDQASTRIVTEANAAPSASAPARSSRPKGRPATLGKRPNSAVEIQNALDRATAEAAQGGSGTPVPDATPVGHPLTSGEKDGLRLAVQKCWNVGSLSTDAMQVTVTVGVTLAKDGKPVSGSLHMISSPDGSNAAAKQAYEAARRAIIRCGAKGFDLPPEKYDHWREIEMTFNPEKMRIK